MRTFLRYFFDKNPTSKSVRKNSATQHGSSESEILSCWHGNYLTFLVLRGLKSLSKLRENGHSSRLICRHFIEIEILIP
jgi:hypothetical protein